MERVSALQLGNFFKRYRLSRGVIKRLALLNDGQESKIRLSLQVTEVGTNQKIRLRLEMRGLEEFRLQRRPIGGLVKITEARLGYFNNLIYLNLDAYADDVSPQLMDFRASDAFIGARELWFEVVTKPSSS